MCGRAMYNKNLTIPGDYLTFTVEGGKIVAGKWGMLASSFQPQVNVRIEQLRQTWKNYEENRGILEVDGFFEKEFYFHLEEERKLLLPIIYDEDFDFAILTRKARKKVEPIHNRQPILIKPGEENLWLTQGTIIQLEDDEMVRIHQTKMKKAA